VRRFNCRIDAELVIPNTTLSIYENAIFRGEAIVWDGFRDELVNNAYKFDFPFTNHFMNYLMIKKELIWTGNSYFQGLNDFLRN
jgi:excinuclease ABC subunit A